MEFDRFSENGIWQTIGCTILQIIVKVIYAIFILLEFILGFILPMVIILALFVAPMVMVAIKHSAIWLLIYVAEIVSYILIRNIDCYYSFERFKKKEVFISQNNIIPELRIHFEIDANEILICEDKKGELYLASKHRFENKNNKWIISKLDMDTLIDLLLNKITVHEAIVTSSDLVYTAEENNLNKIKKVEFSDIYTNLIPTDDCYVNLEKIKYSKKIIGINYLDFIRSILSPTL